jgi:tetratricopeptide (TPR) repeat protein
MFSRAAVVLLVLGASVGGLEPGAGWAASDADRAIQLAQRALRRNPADALAYYRLGDAHIRRARETGDLTHFDRAERALRHARRLAPSHAGPARHLAYVLYARHQFADAAREAERALGLDPDDGHAWGILGDARLEVGRYDDADDAYAKMIERVQDLHAWGRLAGLRTVRGDAEGAIALLRRAVAEGRAAGRPAESVAWAEWQLAVDEFAIGRLAAAERDFRASLRTYPGYHRALAGLGQVQAARGRFVEAVEHYRRALAVVPLPEYAAALGDVYAKLGRQDDARRQYDLVEYIGSLGGLDPAIHNRELAYFYAEHDMKLDRALELARAEFAQRRDVYGWDVLAWTLYKNGRIVEARTAIAEALRPGTRDARLYFHAGMIHSALGETGEARRLLERALAINPRFHVLHADVAARTLRGLATTGGVATRPTDGR